MLSRIALFVFALLAPGLAAAASSVQLVTPQATSVAGGESQVFIARFFDALGQPAVGEPVRWGNDACGDFVGGGIFHDSRTDATGAASATFVAMIPPGITCWLTATAGVTARFDVYTYPASFPRPVATLDPAHPAPGQPFTVNVSVASGIYRLKNVDVSATVIAGSGSASLDGSVRNTGSSGVAEYRVTPWNAGEYEIEVRFRNNVQRVKMAPPPTTSQDMWWVGQSGNGWGMSVVQHDDILFSVIYAYDAAGKPTWFVMPGGTWNADRTAYTGAVYVPKGSPFSTYDVAKFEARAPAGTVTLTRVDPYTINLESTIGGVRASHVLQRQQFASTDTTPAPEVGDMWWGGFAQNGWGIAVLKQERALFNVWFTYDASGEPTWFVMPTGSWTDANTYEGRLYRTTGSPWVGRAYDAGALRVFDIGTFRFRFGAEAATFDYMIDGRSGTMGLTRQPF